jgi:erythromycin esterase
MEGDLVYRQPGYRAICAVSVVLAASSCAYGDRTGIEGRDMQVKAGTVTGRVIDDSGRGLSGARVALVDRFAYRQVALATADAEGRFAFGATPGLLVVTATRRGFRAAYSEVASDKAVPIELKLSEKAESRLIGGTVVTESGKPVGGARVRVVWWDGGGGETYYTFTGSDGGFALKVPVGENYEVSIDDDAYASQFHAAAPSGVELIALPRAKLDSGAASDVVAALGRHCASLESAAAMAALTRAMEGADVIGLGESTHGTKEFASLRTAAIEHLVKNDRLTTVALEAGFVDVLPIHNYVTQGEGTARAAVGNLQYWPWRTEEFVALVEAVRRLNKGRGADDQIEFLGIDFDSAKGIVDRVRVDLAAHPDVVGSVAKGLDRIDDWRAADAAALRDAIGALDAALKAVDAGLSGPTPSQLVRHYLSRAKAYAERIAAGGRTWGDRDVFMADSVQAVLDLGGRPRRVALWAHNGHVARTRSEGVVPLGAYLAERMGDRYRVVATAFNAGSFLAYNDVKHGLVTYEAPPAQQHFLDADLATACRGAGGFLDLRAVARDPSAAPWLSTWRQMRTYGSYEISEYYPFEPVKIGEHYDGVLFVRNTTALTPLPY